MNGLNKKMKKKILFINGHLNTGGVEKSLADILRKIDLNKFDVKLLLLENYGDYINQIPKNVKIELFDLHNTYGSLLKSLTNCLKQRDKKCFWTRIVFFLTRWFGRDKLRWLGKTIFKNEEYDCVIGFRPGIATELAAYAVTAKRKITWWHHGEMNLNIQQKKDYENACKKMDYVVSVSEGCANFLKKEILGIDKKLYIIPNMLDIENIIKKSEEYKPFEKNKEIIDFVTVGRLSPEKHVENAIKVAWKLEENTKEKFRWFIVGDGSERNKLQNMIDGYGLERQVVLVGSKENPYPYMKNADFLVHTSYVESQCLAVLEAMALGIPCIVTKSIGINEFAMDGYNCFLVEQNGVALENTILKTIQQKLDVVKISKNGINTAKNFSEDKIISRIETIFENIE